jgi:HEAT repeat protein/TolA-binding protein
MKSITLAMLVAVAGAAATVAHAQDPVPPTPPARPAPAARPMIAPRAIVDIDAIRDLNMDQIREAQRFAREEAPRIAEQAREMARENADMVRESSRAAMEAAREISRMDLGRGFASMPPMPPLAPMAVFGGDDFRVHAPPAPWAQGDPADSVYRVARDAFIRGEYGRAARLFEDIRTKYPRSAYAASDAQYYEALSRYKIGTTDELHTAAKVLEPIASRILSATPTQTVQTNSNGFYEARRNANDNEVATLYARINGVLAQRGDNSAAELLKQYASKTGKSFCDNEDVQVKIEALNALSQMDPNTALPLFKRVLDRKDECSAELRRRAVFMLARRSDNESAQLVITAAKSDPSSSVRAEAINALPRLTGDVGINALEDVLRADQDERIQGYAVRALMSSDNPKARASMRALVERKDAPVKLRIDAINSFNTVGTTTDDVAYLRNLYAKADNDRIKEAIINAVSRTGGSDNDKWVLSIAQNQNESNQLRSAAISRLIRSNVSVADLGKLFDSADSYNVRSQLVNVFGSRKEPEATDKLIDIIRNSTDYKIKTQALNALTRKNDPRSIELLNNILDGKKP